MVGLVKAALVEEAAVEQRRILIVVAATGGEPVIVTDKLWSLDDMAALVEAREESDGRRNPEGLGEAARRALASSPVHLPVRSCGGQDRGRCVVRRNGDGIGCEAKGPATGDGLHALVVNGPWERHDY